MHPVAVHPLLAFDPSAVVLILIGRQLARSVLKIALDLRLLAGVTLLLILSGIVSLLLSGLVFRDWWQGFFLELGVGLLVVSIVEVAVLGTLHELTDGRMLRNILDATHRIEKELMEDSVTTTNDVAAETGPSAAGGSTPAPG
jgi:hypothetical protein